MIRDIFDEMYKRMHDLDTAFGGFELVPVRTKELGLTRTARANIYETKTAVVAEFELPGVDKKDIDLNITEDEIEVQVKRAEKTEVKDKAYYCYEAKEASFYRKMSLPKKVIPDKAKAEFKDGMLKVEMPKAAPEKIEKKKRILIK